jgi:hypothetical protein
MGIVFELIFTVHMGNKINDHDKLKFKNNLIYFLS